MPYEEVVDRGPAPEALANPYLAAEHFLRQQGLSRRSMPIASNAWPTLPAAGQQPVVTGRTLAT